MTSQLVTYELLMEKLSRDIARNIRKTQRWQRLSSYIRKKYPLCYNPFGDCIATIGDDVHHIIPIRRDPSLAYDKSNLVTLCRRCHSIVEQIDIKYGDSTFLFNNDTGAGKSLCNTNYKTARPHKKNTHAISGGGVSKKCFNTKQTFNNTEGSIFCNRLKTIKTTFCGMCKVND